MGDDVVYSGTIGAAIEGDFAKNLCSNINHNRKPKYLDDIEKTQSLFADCSNKIHQIY